VTESRRWGWALWVAIACIAVPAQASFWMTHGPNKAIRALVIDPSTPGTLYAGGDQGTVFKSTDSGSSWTPANSGLPATTVRSLAIDPTSPTTLYAGTGGNGAYKTTDGGASWSPAKSGLASNVNALAINPLDPSVLYAGTNVGVYRTSDSGGSWVQANSGIGATMIAALAIDPVNPSRVYAATLGAGAFKTTNDAANWGSISGSVGEEYVVLPSSVKALALDPTNPFTIYAGSVSDGVFRSFNSGGQNWRAINGGLTNLTIAALAIDPTNPNSLYAATGGGGIFKTSMVVNDAGVTLGNADPKNIQWGPINSGLTDYNVAALAVDPSDPNMLYAGVTDPGVFVQTQLCSAVPQTGCWMTVAANKSVLTLKDKTNNKQDLVLWKWLKGEADTVADFGDPLNSTHYSICLYDESGVTPELLLGATAAAGGICGPKSKPCWKATGKTGFKYKDSQRTNDGIDSISLKAGGDGKAKAAVLLKGISLAMPTLPLNVPVRVQLQSVNGNCWESTFSTVRKNLPNKFDARSD
jgi:hypothetical protein